MTFQNAAHALAHIAQPSSRPEPPHTAQPVPAVALATAAANDCASEQRARAATALGWNRDEAVVQDWKLPLTEDETARPGAARSLGTSVTRPMDQLLQFAEPQPPQFEPAQMPPMIEEPALPTQAEPQLNHVPLKVPNAPVDLQFEEQIKLAEAEALTPEEEERYAIFEKLGRSRHQMMSVDLGSLDVDAHFDALEQSIAADQQVEAMVAARKPPIEVRELDDFELMSELSTLQVEDEPLAEPAVASNSEDSDANAIAGEVEKVGAVEGAEPALPSPAVEEPPAQDAPANTTAPDATSQPNAAIPLPAQPETSPTPTPGGAPELEMEPASPAKLPTEAPRESTARESDPSNHSTPEESK